MARYTITDVRRAFERYVELTGDHQAEIDAWAPGDRYGTRYKVINARTSISASSCGAEGICEQIRAFCAGWQSAKDGLRAPFRSGGTN